jgi:hypothetical protein
MLIITTIISGFNLREQAEVVLSGFLLADFQRNHLHFIDKYDVTPRRM